MLSSIVVCVCHECVVLWVSPLASTPGPARALGPISNKALQQSPLVESPILGGVSFKPSGNPSVAKFAMYNVRGTSLVRVFEWQNGTWRGVDNEHITWPGGGTEVPSDREPIRLSTQVLAWHCMGRGAIAWLVALAV